MHAVLLAGGKGTRLRPFTTTMPKSLLPIDGVPLIESLIADLRDQGIEDFTVVTGHLAETIEYYLGCGERLGVRIRYLREARPLDTAGCLGQLARPAEPFLFVNADIVTSFQFLDLVVFHHRLDATASVAVCRHRVNVEFGVVESGTDGILSGYDEEPGYDLCVSMGIYCLNPAVCRYVGRGERISMPQLLLRLHNAGEPVRVYRDDCYWRAIGRAEDYALAKNDAIIPFHRAVARLAA